MDADGAKLRTFVCAGGSVLAWQVQQGTVQRVVWEHRDPSDASFRTTDSSGYPWGHADEEEAAELDPTGGNAGLIAPIVEPGPPPDEANDSLIPYPRFHDARRASITYAVDYVQVTVDYFFQQLDMASHGSSLQLAEAGRRWRDTSGNKPSDQPPDDGDVIRVNGYIPSGYWEWAPLFILPAPPQNPATLAPNGLASDRRLSDEECDKKLAQIFGGAGAVVGSTRDPLSVGSNANALAYAQKYGFPTDRIGERSLGHGPAPYDNPDPKSGDRGGIIHIFGNAQGTPSDTPLYAPHGGTVGQIGKDSLDNLYRRVSYGTGLTITFMHVIPGGGPSRSGSVFLGTIGGLDSGADNYRHSHLIFYSNFAKGIRVDPRKVFCGQ
jgi:hypothetical protein